MDKKNPNIILGGLLQTEESAGLKKGHDRNTAHGLLHWLLLPYLPVWRKLTPRPAPFGLCTAPMEQAEADEQAEARPHLCSASSPPPPSTQLNRERRMGECEEGQGGQREETQLETRSTTYLKRNRSAKKREFKILMENLTNFKRFSLRTRVQSEKSLNDDCWNSAKAKKKKKSWNISARTEA